VRHRVTVALPSSASKGHGWLAHTRLDETARIPAEKAYTRNPQRKAAQVVEGMPIDSHTNEESGNVAVELPWFLDNLMPFARPFPKQLAPFVIGQAGGMGDHRYPSPLPPWISRNRVWRGLSPIQPLSSSRTSKPE